MRDADHITDDPQSIQQGDVAVLGIPWDGSSTFLRGAAEAPPRIRQALLSPARNLTSESGLDLGQESRFRILPDLDFATADEPFAAIEAAAGEILERGGHPLGLGGDHAVTLGLVRACAGHTSKLTILQVDAHPDLYEEYEGDRYSHASPMARIMDEGLAQRMIQVGIRAMTNHQRRQAVRFGVEVVEMTSGQELSFDHLDSAAPVYVSIDLDGLDPAFAPGVSHPEPGGLTVRQVLDLIQRLSAPLMGADVVELNPSRDSGDLTAILAAKLVKELAAKILQPESA
jgi:agmatinase